MSQVAEQHGHDQQQQQQIQLQARPASSQASDNIEVATSDEITPPPSPTAPPPAIIDLCHDGSFDRCWKMLAEKISNPDFWTGAEHFLRQCAPPSGHKDVREALARHIRHLFGVSIHWEDELLLVPNELVALEAFAHSYCSPGDVIICPAPYADPEMATMLGTKTDIQLMAIHLEDGRDGLNLADLQRTKQEVEEKGRRVRALLLHNPHPLLGSIPGGDRRLSRILEWTSEHNLYLIVDESLAAMDLWEFSSCLSLDHRGPFGQNLFWLWSATKHFSLPGLEFAALLAPRPDQLLPFLQSHPCAPLVQFLTARLLNDFDWASELFATRKSRLGELRGFALAELGGMGIRWMDVSEIPTQWFLVDLKPRDTEINAETERAIQKDLAQHGLLLTSGEQLGMEQLGFGWFRLRVAESEEHVQKVFDRLRMMLETKRKLSREVWERMDMSKYGGKSAIVWDELSADGIGADEGRLLKEVAEEEEAEGEEEVAVKEKEKKGETMMVEIGEKWPDGWEEADKKQAEEYPDMEGEEEEREKQEEARKEENEEHEEEEQRQFGGKTPAATTKTVAPIKLAQEEEDGQPWPTAEWVESQREMVETNLREKSEEEAKRSADQRQQRQNPDVLGGVEHRRQTAGEQTTAREEQEEMMRRVFDIFPAERLRWRHPLVDQLGADDVPGSSSEGISEKKEEMPETVEKKKRAEERREYHHQEPTELWGVGKGREWQPENVREDKLSMAPAPSPSRPTVPMPTLTDFSFIEELVRTSDTGEGAVATAKNGGEREQGAGGTAPVSASQLPTRPVIIIHPSEFYDAPSMDEEEELDGKKEAEGAVAPIKPLSYHPLTIEVPIRVVKKLDGQEEEEEEQQQEEGDQRFSEGSDSKRIIEIIDQIFQEAVQIRDFSSSSNDSQPFTYADNSVAQQQQQQQPPHSPRSDSGLAFESPIAESSSFSPPPLPSGTDQHQPLPVYRHFHQHMQLSSVAEYSSTAGPELLVESPEPTKNEEAMLIEAGRFQGDLPLETSAIMRGTEGRWRRVEGGEEEKEEEEERHRLGPTAQLLNDSGIFVEMVPGSLSIDFPLLVPAEQLRGPETIPVPKQRKKARKEEEEEEDEGMGGMAHVGNNVLTIDLQFRAAKTESGTARSEVMTAIPERRQNIAESATVVQQETRQKTVISIGQPPLPKEEQQQKQREEQLGWVPLETIVLAPAKHVRIMGFGEEEEEKYEKRAEIFDENEQQQNSQADLVAMLNEGSSFCSTPSPGVQTADATFFRIGEAAAEEGRRRLSADVPLWTPLDQMTSEEPTEYSKVEEVREEVVLMESSSSHAVVVDDESGGRKKFSEVLDELEEEERRSRRGTFAEADFYEHSIVNIGGGMDQEKAGKTVVAIAGLGAMPEKRRKSVEAFDVVAEWNARMARKREEEARGNGQKREEERGVDMELQFDERRRGKAAHWAEVVLPEPVCYGRTEHWIDAWGQQRASAARAEVKEMREEGDGMSRTVVRLKPPKKPPRTVLPVAAAENGEIEQQERRIEDGEEDEEEILARNEEFRDGQGKGERQQQQFLVDVPGHSRAYQAHHRMEMHRGRPKHFRRARSRDDGTVVLEHMNITEVDYRGGPSERMERGDRLVTSISTRINQFAADEFFRRLPIAGAAEFMEKEARGAGRLKKYVEVRQRRSQSVPGMAKEGEQEKRKEEEAEKEIGRTEKEMLLIRRVEKHENDEGKEEEEEGKETASKGIDKLYCLLGKKGTGQEGAKNNGSRGTTVFVECRNPEHQSRTDHCDPNRLYTVRSCTMMSENGYKKMKREHDEDGGHGHGRERHRRELHSKFETVHCEWRRNEENGGDTVIRRTATAKHRYKRGLRRARSPARITVTTTRGGQPEHAGECIDRVTVRHTPGSNWIVSSVYKSTEYGWEKRALSRNGADGMLGYSGSG